MPVFCLDYMIIAGGLMGPVCFFANDAARAITCKQICQGSTLNQTVRPFRCFLLI